MKTQRKPAEAVIVTGANGEIGEATCLRLAEIGYRVYGISRRPHDFPSTGHLPIENVIVPEITNDELVTEFFKQICGGGSKVSGLVCAAGHFERYDSFETPSKKEWMDTLEINVYGTFLWNREFARFCLRNGHPGSIVNVTSQAAFTGGYTSVAPYASSKGGVTSFSKSLARELAKDAIRVNCLAPGFIETGSMSGSLSESALEEFQLRVPMARFGTAQEVADSIVFLLEDSSSYITGATIDLSGGQLML